MFQRIGTCSICGGDVHGHYGAWHGVLPPPPPTCSQCGAVPKGTSDVIEMEPRRGVLPYTGTASGWRLW